jgi:hypothetical protein
MLVQGMFMHDFMRYIQPYYCAPHCKVSRGEGEAPVASTAKREQHSAGFPNSDDHHLTT